MSRFRVEGLAETYSLFDSIPKAAQDEAIDMLGAIGQAVLAEERAVVAVKTGALRAELSFQIMLQQLRVRIGLLNLKGKRSKFFYGRIVNFGRKAQTVLVTRMKGRTRWLWHGRKRVTEIRDSYTMNVSALAARPFVDYSRPALDAAVAEQLAAFWSKTMDRAGASS